MTTSTTSLTWHDVLSQEKSKPYFVEIMSFLQQQRQANSPIYPPQEQLFNAFKSTSLDAVKVVILGQDPYHGAGQAHGLAFSVNPGIPCPPSLKNIFKALHADLNTSPPPDGCLTPWAQQGVLLLNATLTVAAGQPQSHAKIGWHTFTDTVIDALNQHEQATVFLLWGASAQSKAQRITNPHHLILQAPHPSPLSAHRGFFACRHFSKANAFLQKAGRQPIEWQL
jgi:uracil-DNA glycosylase